jgi:hypothetical protein
LCQKCAKTHLRPSEIGKNFPGVIPRTPEGRREGRGEKKGEDRGRGGKGEEREGKEGEGRGYSPSKNVCLSSPLKLRLNVYYSRRSRLTLAMAFQK